MMMFGGSTHKVAHGAGSRDSSHVHPLPQDAPCYRPSIRAGDPLVLRLSGMSAFPSTATTLQFIRPQLPGRYTVVGTPNQLQVYAESELAACLQNWTLTAACRFVLRCRTCLQLSQFYCLQHLSVQQHSRVTLHQNRRPRSFLVAAQHASMLA